MVIVDDDAGLRLVARLFAEEEGWQVVGEAETGQEGVRLIRRLAPDAVIMDYRMPVLDGVGATRRITRSHPDVRIIAWSSDEDPSVRDAFLAAGAYGVAAKGDTARLRELLRGLAAQPA